MLETYERMSDTDGDAVREAKRVLLVAQLDGFANGVKPAGIERFLRSRGHQVEVVNTLYLTRASTSPDSILRKLPRPGMRRLALYAVELAALLLTRRWGFGRRHLSYGLIVAEYHLRKSLLASLLDLDEYDLVICEHPHDAGLLTVETSALRFYDCPNPFADETWFEGRLTPRQHRKLRDLETRLFESVDALSFSWESYARYALKHYGISGHNLVQLNWGCTPAARRVQFESPPKVVYLGSLSSRFINLPLLAELTKRYPHIDVYGAPAPDPSLGLNYKGWAPPTVLQDYQFGLITTSHDEIRQEGFSAKHLDYIAYGLPVLVPEWRRHMDLIEGSVPYNEDTFASVVDGLSNERDWQAMSDQAFDQAQRLTWDKTMSPLDALLRGASPREAAALGPVR
jgi:hypothetical protein